MGGMGLEQSQCVDDAATHEWAVSGHCEKYYLLVLVTVGRVCSYVVSHKTAGQEMMTDVQGNDTVEANRQPNANDWLRI